MTIDDLLSRLNAYRREMGQPEVTRDDIEAIEFDSRRSLCGELEDYFFKQYTIALTGGVGTIYSLSGSINTDLLWDRYCQAVHEDGMPISILPFGSSAHDLTYPRFEAFYWAVIEVQGTVVTLTVWQGDGETAVDDGDVTVDFAAVQSLANWPTIHESLLVARCAELLKVEAAA
jgi:hypothetical protein